ITVRKEMRVEELLRHGRRDVQSTIRGKRRKNHGDIQVALVICRENDGPVYRFEIFASRDSNVRKDSSQRQQKPWKGDAPNRARETRAIVRGEFDRLGGRRRGPLKIGDLARRRE